MQDEHRLVQIDEIATQLGVPRHFMGKDPEAFGEGEYPGINKGPYGGFSLHNQTLSLPLLTIYKITDGLGAFKNCVLCLKECNGRNPCPLHNEIVNVKESLMSLLERSTLSDLVKGEKKDLIRSIGGI